MKINTTIIGIQSLVLVAIIINLFFAYNFFRLARAGQQVFQAYVQLQGNLSKVNQNVILVQRLGIEALQYATEHPELQKVLSKHVPLLQQIHLLTPTQTGQNLQTR